MTKHRSNHPFAAIGAVEVVPVGEIATGGSFRIFKRETVRKAARFLETFGLKVPIILDARNEIVEGEIWFYSLHFHGLAARERGFDRRTCSL